MASRPSSPVRSSSRAHWVDLLRQAPWIYPRGIVASAEEWIAQAQRRVGWYAGLRGDWRESVYPAGQTVFAPPTHLPEPDRIRFRDSAVRCFPGASVCFFSGAYVWSHEGVVLTRTNRVLAEYHHQFTTRSLRHHLLAHPFRMFRYHTQRVDPATALLAAPQGWNHYHWVFDVLPRVHLLQRWRPVIEQYLVPAQLSAAQLESLRILGITADQLFRLEPPTRLRCQRLYVPSLPGSEGCTPPWAVEFLREAFTAAAERTPGQGRRLYVRRGAGAQRPVLNEPDLIARLQHRGFQVIDPSELSFVQQVAAFRDAAVVVGAHGAGLANLVFSRATAVLEFLPAEYARTDCYFTLCRQLGLNYDAWLAPRVPTDAPWGAIHADVEEIDRRITRLEQATAPA
jgi:capsular polysaccharide biosynthesis protein